MPYKRVKLIAFTAAAAGAAVYVYAKRSVLRDYASELCEVLSTKPAIGSDLARDAFTNTNVDQVVGTPGHTHASAAALRTAATRFAQNVAQYCGSELFVVGMSKTDQRRGLKGTRRWYWAKDANADNRNDSPGDRDVRYLCDVDYYVDMPQLLVTEAKPVLIYTVVPETATSSGCDDTSFHFNEQGELVTLVAGSGKYQHPLWNYSSDSFLVVDTFIGIPTKAVVYAVERKQIGEHRQVIIMAPIREFGFTSAWLASMLLETKPLIRFDPVVQSEDGRRFIRFNTMKPDGELMVTTAVPGCSLSATVTQSQDDSVAIANRLGTTNLMLPTVASWVKERHEAAVLTDYHRSCGKTPKAVVYPVAIGVRAYQYNPKEFDADAKPKLQSFMSPFVHGAFCPVPNKAGEEACIAGRVTGLRKPEPRPSNFRDRCMDEFANLILKQGVHLEPVCFEVVNAKQTSAAQQLSLRKATLMGPFRKLVLKCFLKAEAYPDVKDPRNISTYNDGDKLDMARYALALSEYMKQFPWYGPGKKPKEIAQRVTEICQNSDFVNISDYHRMDGTISYTLRKVDRVVCMKAFTNHGAELNELLKTNADNTGYLPNGTTFDQGPSHGSGCSATSLFQTLRAAFNAYLAFRHTNQSTGQPYSPEEAFSALGIHLGDDGIDGNLPIRSHEWASRLTGLIIEASIVERGDRGVNFLARYYSPSVWTGLPDSMCDIKRQLSKFHTTVRLPFGITPEQKFVEKAASYVATDGNTPIIGPLCKKLLLLSSHSPRNISGIGSWWSKFAASDQFPNRNVDGWMDVELEHQFPEFSRSRFEEWLAKSSTPTELLQPPICAEPKPATVGKFDVVVDEEVLKARSDDAAEAKAEAPIAEPAKEEKSRSRRKTRAATGKPTFKSTTVKSSKSKVRRAEKKKA
nr:MAG: RNA-dependent RNA polymerase [brine shrimp noda-like virus 2]